MYENWIKMDKVHLRLIGDVHGKIDEYIALASQAEYSIQLGDLGFDYGLVRKHLDPTKHRVLGGNHDNYYEENGKFVFQPPHFLGDYGLHNVPGAGDFFFVRGGHSIDKQYRDEGVDWFPGEQITYRQGTEALKLYEALQPQYMLSHECPASLIEHISGIRLWDGVPLRPSMTAHLLDQMWELHKPKVWVFGHHHRNWYMAIQGTGFRCLAELSYLDLPKIPEGQ